MNSIILLIGFGGAGLLIFFCISFYKRWIVPITIIMPWWDVNRSWHRYIYTCSETNSIGFHEGEGGREHTGNIR